MLISAPQRGGAGLDIGQVALTVGGSVGGWLAVQFATHLYKSGRKDKQDETFDSVQKQHGEWLVAHDRKFEQLPTLFVPRTELTGTLTDIRESQRCQENMVLKLLMKLAGVDQ